MTTGRGQVWAGSLNGWLNEVRWEWDGTELSADAALGAVSLAVLDTVALSTDESVWVGETGPYAVTAIDEDNALITISPGLTADLDETTQVVPDAGGQPGRQWVAEVVLPDADQPIEVPLTVHDLAVMPEGIYDPPWNILISDDAQTVLDLPGLVPVVDGGYIPPDTLPDQGGGSDGDPPPFSPAPVVTGGIGAFYLRWAPPPNDDTMRFEVHVSPNDGFVPSTDTLYSETGAYSLTVRNLPYIDPATGEYAKFLYEKPYYFRIVAKDVDGSAAPGTQASDLLVQVNTPDIATRSVIAEQIVTGTLTGDLFAGQVVLGSTISTGSLDADGNITGARVDLGPDGLIIYGTDGKPITAFPLDQKGDAYIRQAHLEIYSADVIDNFVMHGLNNRIDASAKFTLGKGIEAPSATPQIQQTYDHVQFDTTTVVASPAGSAWPMGNFAFNPSEARCMAWGSDANQSCWRVVQEKGNGFRLWRFNANGTLKINIFTGLPWVDDFKGFHRASVSDPALLFTNNVDWIIWGPTAGGTLPASWIINDNQDPYLGWDAGAAQNILIQNQQGSGARAIQHRRFTQDSSGAPVGQGIYNSPVGTGSSSRINGVYYGAADFGGARYATTRDGTDSVLVYAGATRYNTNGSYQEWRLEVASQAFGWDGLAFWSLAASGIATKYTNWTWTADPVTTSVGMSGFDSSTAGDQANPWPGQSAGQHETPVGTLTGIQMRRRSKLLVTVPITPAPTGGDNQDKWKVYWSRTGTLPPAKTDMHLVATLGDPNVTTAITMTADSVGANPPGGVAGQAGSANNFPAGNPALLQSAGTDTGGTPIIQLKGDGSGRAGPYRWDKNGADLVKNGYWVGYLSSATNNLVSGTFTTVTGISVDPLSTAPEWNAGAPGGLISLSIAGTFLFIASGSIANSTGTSTRRIIALMKNGVEVARLDTGAPGSGPGPVTLRLSHVMRVTPSDNFSITLWQNSGVNTAMAASPGHDLQCIKLSD